MNLILVSMNLICQNSRMGESVEVNEVTAMEDYTKPPARYNQATLLDKMESEGIGTKSTRADIINLLIKRKYIIQDKID